MFKNFFKKKTNNWVYGTLDISLGVHGFDEAFAGVQKARKNTINGEVQFVLWKAGQQGHKEDYWHRFDPSWWDSFIQDSLTSNSES